MRELGFDPDALRAGKKHLLPQDVHAYQELHIEQGPCLEQEGLVLGVAGAVLEVGLALGLAWAVNHSGLTWLPPGNSEPVPLTVRVWGETLTLVWTALGLLVVSAVSAWWPARRAAQLDIVEALRHV